MNTKHTPTPWEFGEGNDIWTADGHDTFIGSTAKGDCGFDKNQANAAFIVRAVNSHEALLNIARWLVQEREAGTDKGLLPDGLLNATRKAIAEAEGK